MPPPLRLHPYIWYTVDMPPICPKMALLALRLVCQVSLQTRLIVANVYAGAREHSWDSGAVGIIPEARFWRARSACWQTGVQYSLLPTAGAAFLRFAQMHF